MLERQKRIKLKPIIRNQPFLEIMNLEDRVAPNHPVRGIWEFLERLDLSSLYKKIKSYEGEAGSTPHDPQLLLALWIYAMSCGIGSSREIETLCKESDSWRWLCGDKKINYHTISDFRKNNREELNGLFVNILGILSSEGLININQICQDGTKIRANAGIDTFKRKGTIEKHLECARKQVKLLSDPDIEPISPQKQKSQERAAKEKLERLEHALQEYENINRGNKKKEKRVSITDPKCRIMKQSNGGYAPSYNIQFGVETQNKFIVDKQISQNSDDYSELEPMAESINKNFDRYPNQMIVDGGYNNKSNILYSSNNNIDLIAGDKGNNEAGSKQYKRRGVTQEFYSENFIYNEEKNIMICPANKILKYSGTEKHVSVTKHKYRANITDCNNCKFKINCCFKNKKYGRSVVRNKSAVEVIEFNKKMKTDEAKKTYKIRGENSEFVNAWLKSKFKLRQFYLRGTLKVSIEITLAVITYNIKRWLKIMWHPVKQVTI